jgi:tetratricopeptide (TPR) repeat protein
MRAAAQLLEPWAQALSEVTDDDGDPRWADGWLLEVRVTRIRGDLVRAEELAERLIERADRHGWERVRAQALLERAVVRQVSGSLIDARADIDEALRSSDDEGVEAEAHLRSALIALNMGDLARVEEQASLSLAFHEAAGNRRGAAATLTVLGGAALRRGEPQQALEIAERAVTLFREGGTLLGIGEALNLQGEALRQVGRLEEAGATYEEALRAFRLAGAWDALLPRVNLALVQIDRGDTERARASLEAVLAELGAVPRSQVSGVLHAYLLPCVARTGEWESFARHLSAATDSLHASGFVDPDVARLAEVAAVQAEIAGQHELATGARDLMHAQRV